MQQKQHGFTLIELVVTISIIGILATLAITQFSKARSQAKASQVKVMVSDAGKAISAFRLQESVGGRVIVPKYTLDYQDSGMSGSTSSKQINSGIADYQSTGLKGFEDVNKLFTGTESTAVGSYSYGATLTSANTKDVVIYYGTTPGSTDSSKHTLASIEGTFSLNGQDYPKCYLLEAFLPAANSSSNDFFFYVLNGHLKSFPTNSANGGANCANDQYN